MSCMKPRSLLKLVIVVFFTLCATQPSAGQNNKPADDKETLQALLTEVRMLRQALQTLQQMSVDTYRSQLLVDRIRVYREDVRRLTTSLNDTRDLLAKTQSTIPQFIERQKLMETQLQLEVDQNKRAQMEFEIKRTRESVEMYKAQIDPLKEREQRLAAELNSEKAKLEELESRLDLLDRTIENDRQRLELDKPPPERKP
jgi:chromosome segregation ATPase